jgi:hypothetical protein
MSKALSVIEHTIPEKKVYLIEEKKYANGNIHFVPVFYYENDPIKSMITINHIFFTTKKAAIDTIKRDIENTPIEVITYEYHP